MPRLRRVWHRLRELSRVDPEVMTHGDLIPGNLLVSRGRLSGLLDVGGFGAADPAFDLVVAWHALEEAPRAAFRRAVGCSDLEWDRGKAWALEQALGLVEYYLHSTPPMSALGSCTLQRLLADEG